MFTKYELTIPDKNDKYYDIIKGYKPPSKILEESSLKKNYFTKIIENTNFILSDDFTNNGLKDNKNILPCNDSNCITNNIFNIMILCCNLVYSLINQTRVNILDYFYTTNLIEELCIIYTLLKESSNIENELFFDYIENIIKQYYSIMFDFIKQHSNDKIDDSINNDVNSKLGFLNTSLKEYLSNDISISDELGNLVIKLNTFLYNYINIISHELLTLLKSLNKFLKKYIDISSDDDLIELINLNELINLEKSLNKFRESKNNKSIWDNDLIELINLIKIINLKTSLNKLKQLINDNNDIKKKLDNNFIITTKIDNTFINNDNNDNIYLKIQNITVDDYTNYFINAYKIITEILRNNNFNTFYANIYIYNYNNIDVINLIKLRTYLILMFIYKIRFINLHDVDDKGGRQAEFFISNVLRDFYNYYYIDNKFDKTTNITNIKKNYINILKNILQYNFFYTKTYSYKNINIHANNNIITLEYFDNINIELFRPFEKMYNINECSYSDNNININNGKIGGDLIYLHECYSKDNSNKYSLNSNSICIIVDSKAYQDNKFYTENKIDKTILQCYLYAQYVKKCYKENIYTDSNNKINLYLSVVNPIYGSYYVYNYGTVINTIKKYNLDEDLQHYKLFDIKNYNMELKVYSENMEIEEVSSENNTRQRKRNRESNSNNNNQPSSKRLNNFTTLSNIV